MIFPILSGIPSFLKAPMTWLLVGINTVVLIWSSLSGNAIDRKMQAIMSDSFFVQTQGRVYASYIDDHFVAGQKPILRDLANEVDAGQSDKIGLLGTLAFRDSQFMKEAPSMNPDDDPVAVRYWRSKLHELHELENIHPIYMLGLNASDVGLSKWVTYIFCHSGFLHYFGNMIFLVLFGGALEELVGSLGLLVVFLTTGIFGAGFFLLLSGASTAPLVGASGAISGVMAVYCFLNLRRPIRFIYWLFLPFQDAMGFVFLPAWVAILIWILTDLAGYLGNLPILGGVAHGAHLGGELSGLVIVLILRALKHKDLVAAPADRDPWTLYPLRFYYHPLNSSSAGANPRRIVFSVTTRGSMN